MRDAVARQFALGASGSPGIEFGFYAYILKEKRGNTWGTLERKSGRVPRCRSVLHAISSAVLFGLDECPQASEESHLLLATDITQYTQKPITVWVCLGWMGVYLKNAEKAYGAYIPAHDHLMDGSV